MLSKFTYSRPESIEEALQYLEENQDTKVLAGGTDLLVLLRRNAIDCKHVLDIKGIPEIQKIEYVPNEGLYIGAAVTVNQLTRHPIIREKYTSLAQGADSLASYQLRNRATIAGNICNASPGADLAPPLLVFQAKLDIVSPRGRRQVDIHEFFTGVKKTVLREDELVLRIFLPDVEEGDQSLYLKQSRLKGHDLATVGLAARRRKDKKILLAMAAVAPTPVRLSALEEEIHGKDLTQESIQWAAGQVGNHISPISDVRSSKEYRLHMAEVLTKRALEQFAEKEGN